MSSMRSTAGKTGQRNKRKNVDGALRSFWEEANVLIVTFSSCPEGLRWTLLCAFQDIKARMLSIYFLKNQK